jgi:non-specific serine/threonine protein kinase
LEEALAIARSIGEPGRIAEIAGSLGYLLLLKRDLDPAASLLREGVEIARGTGNRFQVADGLAALVEIHMIRGNDQEAYAGAIEAIGLFRELDHPAGVGMLLETVAGLESSKGRHDRAMRTAGAARRIRETIGGGAWPSMFTFEDPEPAARAAIGDEAVERALAEGREMDLDAAIAFVLDEKPAE